MSPRRAVGVVVRADDALLDVLGARDRQEPGDALSAVLVAWQAAVDQTPVAELVSTEQAMTAIAHSRGTR